MHVLPQLRKLEQKYSDSLTVIGVHSAKFTAEKSGKNVEEAIHRYKIDHPVVNDARFQIWQSYAARAWPTLMFIDPSGNVIGRHEGEFPLETLDQIIAKMLGEFESDGSLVKGSTNFGRKVEQTGVLHYPGKISFDPERRNLVISDSNNHRLVVTDLKGKILSIIGSKESVLATADPAVYADRSFDSPLFDDPQGVCIFDGHYLVGDVGTHTIVDVDPGVGTATTIAGTGEQSLYRHSGGSALEHPLNSPYDITRKENTLYVAMAGFHQLWSYDLESMQIAPFAGDGGEDIVDDLLDSSRLAQPTGVKMSNNALFFVDSETSSVRVSALIDEGRVVTLVGTGLFDFGDHDGVGKEALLQHPQGIDVASDNIFVADTYNNKIKSLAIGPLQVRTVAGSGETGANDGHAFEASFNEPSGLSVFEGKVYVADTNNHAIRVIELATQEVSTLEIGE